MTAPVRINPNGQVRPSSPSSPQRPAADGGNFADLLAQASTSQGVKFSNHAQKRLQTREIAISDDGLARLATAIDKADQRGGRESLVLMDEMAFIVNVKERLVVTALDARSRGEGVFTQIDSVVLADSGDKK